MKDGIYKVDDVDICGLPVNEEIRLCDSNGKSYLERGETIIYRGDKLVEIKIIGRLNGRFEKIGQVKRPQTLIRLDCDLEATRTAVKKYTTKFDENSFRFIDSDVLQYSILVKVNKVNDIIKAWHSFQDDLFKSAQKLYTETCDSLGLKPMPGVL